MPRPRAGAAALSVELPARILQDGNRRMRERIVWLPWLAAVLVAACSASDPPVTEPETDAAVTLPGSDAGLAEGLGAAVFGAGELDEPSNGGTITFQNIGAPGWYPSRRDPALGPCDAYQKDTCCLGVENVTSDALTPWDQDLVMTLRGPLTVKQLAVYQPASADSWALVSAFDDRHAAAPEGLAFHGNDTQTNGFPGAVGSECLVDVSTAVTFPCGAGSEPYCPPSNDPQHLGWQGSKLFVLLARMPHAADVPGRCSQDDTGNWFDAPWLGLSLGELARAGAFSSCQCYAKNPDEWYLADGCGQLNVFEVVNDNNQYKNLDVFSTNFFGYAGYVGEGPCGPACSVASLSGAVDLIDKAHDTEAAAGATAGPAPQGGPGAAFRRPVSGYRYFVVLLDVATRQVQLGVIHPRHIPGALAPLLPALPAVIPQSAVDDLLALRLPR
jgi:hypothetical protein